MTERLRRSKSERARDCRFCEKGGLGLWCWAPMGIRLGHIGNFCAFLFYISVLRPIYFFFLQKNFLTLVLVGVMVLCGVGVRVPNAIDKEKNYKNT